MRHSEKEINETCVDTGNLSESASSCNRRKINNGHLFTPLLVFHSFQTQDSSVVTAQFYIFFLRRFLARRACGKLFSFVQSTRLSCS